jgi:hypothetical protein
MLSKQTWWNSQSADLTDHPVQVCNQVWVFFIAMLIHWFCGNLFLAENTRLMSGSDILKKDQFFRFFVSLKQPKLRESILSEL